MKTEIPAEPGVRRRLAGRSRRLLALVPLLVAACLFGHAWSQEADPVEELARSVDHYYAAAELMQDPDYGSTRFRVQSRQARIERNLEAFRHYYPRRLADAMAVRETIRKLEPTLLEEPIARIRMQVLAEDKPLEGVPVGLHFKLAGTDVTGHFSSSEASVSDTDGWLEWPIWLPGEYELEDGLLYRSIDGFILKKD